MKNLFLAFIIHFFCCQNSHAQANIWTWLKGSNTFDQEGMYGSQGVPLSGNTPGSRRGSISWSLNGKIYLSGGYGNSGGSGGFFSDLWEYNPTTNNWRWLKGNSTLDVVAVYGTQGQSAATNTPGGRINSASWVLNGKLYLFGGEPNSSQNAFLNDLWEYNPVTNNWRWLKGGGTGISNQAGNYGTQGVAESFTLPGNRTQSHSWEANGKLYLFGGKGFINNGVGYYNDLWEYNPATFNWRWLKGANTPNQAGTYGTKGVFSNLNKPGARVGGYTGVYNGLLYLMGGFGYDATVVNSLNDVWEYNPTTNNWRWLNGSNTGAQLSVFGTQGVPNASNTPGSRGNGASWSTVGGKIYIMGGFGYVVSNTGNLNDLWEYNVNTNIWTWLKGSTLRDQEGIYGTVGIPSINNAPGGRFSQSYGAINDKLYLFGGFGDDSNGDTGYLNDLWVYETVCTDMFSLNSGNWNDTNTWSCGRVPIATDKITIKGHAVNLIGDCFAKSIFYSNNGTVILNANSKLKF